MSMANMQMLLLLAICVSCSYGYYFNYYVYAQQWPTPFCDSDPNAKHANGSCHLAPNITKWTNHGLWPSVNETYPNYCNNSWHLKEADFTRLEDDMRARWPSFDGTDFEFWKHEWSKHGTCAANVTFLHGPYNYFKFVLDLNDKWNLHDALAIQGISPSKTCYSYAKFQNATWHLFQEHVILSCVYDKETKIQQIAQIEICFDKQFNLKCDPDVMKKRRLQLQLEAKRHDLNTRVQLPYIEPCWNSEDICYFPIPH